MYLAVAVIVPFLSIALNAASPGPHEQLVGLEDLDRRSLELNIRQNGELAFCFGTNSICATSNDLYQACSDKFDAFSEEKKWTECSCKNGFVSVREACEWCKESWKISSDPDITKLYSDGCSSYSFTIAPVPATVLSLQASYNITWTGTLIGAAPTGKTLSALKSGTSITKSSFTSSSFPSRSTGGSNTATFVITQTIGGGGNFPEPTGVPTTTGASSSKGSGSGAASVLNTGAGLLISIAVFAFAGMILL